MTGDIAEKKISDSQSEITEGKILEVSDDGKAIMQAYRLCKEKGMNVYRLEDARRGIEAARILLTECRKWMENHQGDQS